MKNILRNPTSLSRLRPRIGGALALALFALSTGCLQVRLIGSSESRSPAVEITTYAAQILSANVANFPLSGDCGLNGGRIDLTADSSVSATTTCANGRWSISLDLSPISDGTGIVIEVRHHSLDLVETRIDSITLDKDTTIPTGTSIVADSGNLNTPGTAVSLDLTATGATEMYVTSATGCASGGTWEPYAATKAWTLSSANSSNIVSVKFRNAIGNESACIADAIYSGTGVVMNEDFEDATLHPDLNLVSPATVSAGRLDIPAPDSVAGTNSNALELVPYPALAHLFGATITLEVSQTTTSATAQAQSFLYVADDPAWRGIYFLKEGTLLHFGYDSPGWNSTSVPYDPVAHRWWRLRHDSATDWVYWETAPDGITWTTHRGMLAPADFMWMYPYLIAKTFSSVATPGTFSIENLSITR